MSATRLGLLQLVLGAWLALSGATVGAATLSFRVAPTAEEAAAAPVDAGARAQAMRFNVRMLQGSTRAQLVLAAFAVLLAAWPPGTSRATLACAASAALLSAVLAVGILPRTARIAEQLAIETVAGRVAEDAGRAASFRRLHGAFGAVGLAKSLLVAGAALSAIAAARRRER